MENFARKLKYKKLAALLLLLLLLVLPLAMFRERLQKSYILKLEQDRIESAIRLREEMSEFRADLVPRFFLQKYLDRQLEPVRIRREVLRAGNVEAREAILAEIFKDCRNRLYAADMRFKPLFFMVANGGLDKFHYEFSEKFLKAPKLNYTNVDDPEFLAKFIGVFATSEERSVKTSDDLDFTKIRSRFSKNMKAKMTKLDREGLPKKFFFRGILSSFIKAEPQAGVVSSYFSDIFDFDNILFYTLPVTYNRRLCGLVTVAYLENDLAVERILPPAIGFGDGSKVRRQAISAARGDFSNDKVGPLTLVSNLRTESSLESSWWLKVELLANDHSETLKKLGLVEMVFKILLLVFFLLAVRLWVFDLRISLSLRRKLLFMFFLSMSLPALLGYIIYSETLKLAEKSDQYLARDILDTRFNEIELIYQEVFQRQVINNLRFKLPLLEEIEKKSLSRLNPGKFKYLFGDNVFSSLFYTRTGERLSLLRGINKRKIDLIKLNNAVLALNNLSGLANNKATEDDRNNLSYTFAFAGDIVGIFDFARVAGTEGENSLRASNINELSRSQFYLFPDRGRDNLAPFAIGMMDVGPEFQFEKCLRSRHDFPVRFFSRRTGRFSTELSLALRSSTSILEEFWLEGPNRRNSEFGSFFRRASVSRDSADYFDEIDSRLYSWRFYPSLPIIPVGAVSVDANVMNDFALEFFPWFAGILLVLVLLLVAEIVSRVFLAPINAVGEAIAHISASGNAAVNLEFCNNDEFDRVGDSFNQMARGLMQKKHISRFVSQRLVKAVEGSGAEALTGSAEKREMTILASDIRDFTRISENYPPEFVVKILNEYFTLMEKSIVEEGGIIDRFIGDAIIAVYSSDHCAEPALSACRSAFRMRQDLANYDFKNVFGVEIENGIGIASGMAIAANLGRSFSRKDFTVVGDPVSRAEVLESLTKKGRFTRIMVDEKTRDKAGVGVSVSEMLEFGQLKCFELVEEVENA